MDSRNVGSNDVETNLTDPSQRPVWLERGGDPDAGVRTFRYTPKKEGTYKVVESSSITQTRLFQLKAEVEGRPAFNIDVNVNPALQPKKASASGTSCH